MAVGIGIAVFVPATSISVVDCVGLVEMGTVLQVLNLASGADETSSYDPYIPADDTIVQTNTVPQQSAPCLVVFQLPDEPSVTCKVAIVQSVGNLLPGPAAAANAMPGDVILSAVYPVTNVAVSVAIDYALAFAPTVVTAGDVTQISQVNDTDLVALLIRDNGAADPGVRLGVCCGQAPGVVAVVGCRTGDQILYALNLSLGLVATPNYQPVSPAAGVLNQLSGTPQDNSIILFLLQRSAA